MKVLFVDDEPHILRSIQRLVMRRPYTALYAESGKEALQILKTNAVDAVVSDMMMPGMNGYELLQQVKNLYPSAARIILSGFAEARIIQNAVMQGIATAYLLKPLEIDILVNILKQCQTMRDHLNDASVRNAILSAGPLPVLSQRRRELLALIEAESSADDIVRAVELDSAVSTNILRLANSSFYGHKASVGSIKDAIVFMGVGAVKSILWALTIIDERHLPLDSSLRLRRLQDNSALVCRLTNALYKELNGRMIPDAARSMGLIHDMGMFLLEIRMPDRIHAISNILAQPRDPSLPPADIEKSSFGAGHAEIGAYLLDLWSFPRICVIAALYHHQPAQNHLSPEEQRMISILHLADRYVWRKFGPPDLMAEFEESPAAYEILGKSKEEMDLVIAKIESLDQDVESDESEDL